MSQILPWLWSCWPECFFFSWLNLKLPIFLQRGYFCIWGPGLWIMQQVLPGGGSERRRDACPQHCGHCRHQPHGCERQPSRVQPGRVQCCHKWRRCGRGLSHFGRCHFRGLGILDEWSSREWKSEQSPSWILFTLSPFRLPLIPKELYSDTSLSAAPPPFCLLERVW